LNTVGFEKRKVGSGQKEVGYQIKESSLSSIIGGLLLCFTAMGVIMVLTVFDIRLEKKSFRRQMRVEEHHAASKLAEVQMELWSQYRDDARESSEAARLMDRLNKSYDDFMPKFKLAVDDVANEMSFNPDTAAKITDKILHVAADMQTDNVKHAKLLLDRLVNKGKKSQRLEKHVKKEMLAGIAEESKYIDEDYIDELFDDDEDIDEAWLQLHGASANTTEKDPLKAIIQGFWDAFDNHELKFGGKLRQNSESAEGSVRAKIEALFFKTHGPNALSQDEIKEQLMKIDLEGVGLLMDTDGARDIEDVMEELYFAPEIPHQQLAELKLQWQSGKRNSVSVLNELEHLDMMGSIPGCWLRLGVEKKEGNDALEEEEQEKESEVVAPARTPKVKSGAAES